jgi:hypothetical protein
MGKKIEKNFKTSASCFTEGGRRSHNGAFTLDVKSMLNVNLGGILGGTQC